jgi:hypothetical protein
MAFTGQKKTDYQRNYMRKRRLKTKMMLAERYGVPFKPRKVDADGYVIYD